jgi:hypothetical protein
MLCDFLSSSSSLDSGNKPNGLSGEQPPIPRGVTHGDELMYLFSTGVFNFSEEDWDLSWKMVNLWTNFVIYGYVDNTVYRREQGCKTGSPSFCEPVCRAILELTLTVSSFSFSFSFF